MPDTKTEEPVVKEAEKVVQNAQRMGFQLLLIDDLHVDEAHVNFSGHIQLQNTKGENDLLEALKMGTRVRLTVDCYVLGTGGKAPRDKEGNTERVKKAVGLVVDTISLDKVVRL
jgi:hypothetical protein